MNEWNKPRNLLLFVNPDPHPAFRDYDIPRIPEYDGHPDKRAEISRGAWNTRGEVIQISAQHLKSELYILVNRQPRVSLQKTATFRFACFETSFAKLRNTQSMTDYYCCLFSSRLMDPMMFCCARPLLVFLVNLRVPSEVRAVTFR